MPRTVFSDLANAVTTFRNKAPVPYVAAGRSRGLMLPSMSPAGMEAQMRAAGSVGTLFAIVDRIITAYSQVEWHLYKSAKSGRKEDREEVTDHPALTLWQSPNPFMTGPAFRETTQQHEELTGEQWWVIVPHQRLSMPGELWPVRPDRMEPVPDVEEYLLRYDYRAPGGGVIELDREHVVFLRRPNPLDPYRGMGAVQTILADLEGSRLAAEWVRNFFYNSAQPGGVIEVDHNLSEPQWDEFQARWAESHRGVSNAHRVAMLEQGMKWVDRRFTMQELQIESLRNVPRELIREAFGFPKPMLGTVDDTNRANMEASDTMMARWLSAPRLERTKQAFNTRVLPLYGPLGRGYELDYDNPVPADKKTDADVLAAQARAARDLVAADYFGPDVLAAVGLPEIQFRDPDYDQNRETLIRIVTGAPTTAPIILPLLGFELGGDEGARPQDIADVVQKLYLGVDKVLTWEEARGVLARLGMDLDPAAPRPVVNVTAPAPRVEAAVRVEAERLPLAPRWAGPETRWAIAAAERAASEEGEGEEGGDEEDDDPVRAQFESALEDLLADWVPVEDAWVDVLGDAVEVAVDDEDAGALGSLSVDTAEGAAVLRQALADMAAAAADRMVAEAAEQGVEVDTPDLDAGVSNRTPVSVAGIRAAYGSELVDVAVVTAALLGAELARSAAGEALRLFTPGAVGRQVADGVRSFLRGLKGRFKKDQLGGALHRAQNAGRIAVLEEAPTARYMASELGDRNSCQPCKDVDGTEFDDLDAVRAAYGTGGYLHCEGGIRCRGTVVATWE